MNGIESKRRMLRNFAVYSTRARFRALFCRHKSMSGINDISFFYFSVYFHFHMNRCEFCFIENATGPVEGYYSILAPLRNSISREKISIRMPKPRRFRKISSKYRMVAVTFTQSRKPIATLER